MKSRSFTAAASVLPLALATTFWLAGCSPTLTTRTGATEAEAAMAADLCEHAWRPVTYSSRDTEQTQIEVRAANAARATYCS